LKTGKVTCLIKKKKKKKKKKNIPVRTGKRSNVCVWGENENFS